MDNEKRLENLKPWKPGESGNPEGRPKQAKVFKERCKEYMDSEGWEVIRDIINDPAHKDRFRALELITSYAYGRPAAEPPEMQEIPPINILPERVAVEIFDTKKTPEEIKRVVEETQRGGEHPGA